MCRQSLRAEGCSRGSACRFLHDPSRLPCARHHAAAAQAIQQALRAVHSGATAGAELLGRALPDGGGRCEARGCRFSHAALHSSAIASLERAAARELQAKATGQTPL